MRMHGNAIDPLKGSPKSFYFAVENGLLKSSRLQCARSYWSVWSSLRSGQQPTLRSMRQARHRITVGE